MIACCEMACNGWDGDGLGGHHRSGRLRLEPTGVATGTVELTLDGFGSPIAAHWLLGER